MHTATKIVIIGGGIGGLTCAISLYKKGFKNLQVFERRVVGQSTGAGLVLWANASWVLDQLRLLDGVAQFGGRLNQMQRWTDKGEYLGGIDITKIDMAFGQPSYAVSQAGLQ